MTIAEKLNAWLTPDIRKYIHAAVALIAAVAAIWGLSTDTVNVWVALVIAIGGLGSAVLSAIVTKRADMTLLYLFAAAIVVGLVTLRFVNPALAEQIDNTLSAVVAFSSIFAFTRTDLSTSTGSPAAEVPAVTVTLDATTPDVTSVPASPTVTAIPGATVFNPGDGTPPTTTLS